ncbi:MAG: helix-turn-helix domain-containing protein [Candidatus Cryptobacteroides sp.]
MMRNLFLAVICLALGFLKDSVFLTDWSDGNTAIDNIVNIIDFSVMLVVCNFFCEAVKPESTKYASAWLGPVMELLLIPAYLLFPSNGIMIISYVIAYSIALITVAYIIIYAVKHRKYVSENFSYSENISVRWVAVSSLIYTISIFAYAVLFRKATWLGEAAYCIFSIIIYTYMFYSAKRHKIIPLDEDEPVNEVKPVSDAKNAEEKKAENENGDETLQYIADMIEPKLKHSMQEGKIYLNPKLSLKNVAIEIGSNTKYLSTYLNRSLGISFYDYINSFRVEEACRIFENMSDTGRINMTEVAEMSGFNSVSSFNRYFRTVMGITPKEYYKHCINRHRQDGTE